jgi:hypothetical protein
MKYQGSDMKKLLVIRFHGEDGDDAGGLSKVRSTSSSPPSQLAPVNRSKAQIADYGR